MPTKTQEKKASPGKPNGLQKAAAAVAGAGRGRRDGPAAARRGGPQGLGIHPRAQSAEPGEPPRNPRRRQAPPDLRQGQGDDVRDQQTPRRPSDVTTAGAIPCSGLDDAAIGGMALVTIHHRKTPIRRRSINLFRSFCISAIAGRVSPSIARRPHGNCRRSDGPRVRIRSAG
jgi:hypothetical protein